MRAQTWVVYQAEPSWSPTVDDYLSRHSSFAHNLRTCQLNSHQTNKLKPIFRATNARLKKNIYYSFIYFPYCETDKTREIWSC